MFGFKKAKAAPVEPPPKAEDRKTELAAAIQRNYSDLSALDLEMRDFEMLHFVFLNGMRGIRAHEITERAQIEAEWRALWQRKDDLLRQRDILLSEWGHL